MPHDEDMSFLEPYVMEDPLHTVLALDFDQTITFKVYLLSFLVPF